MCVHGDDEVVRVKIFSPKLSYGFDFDNGPACVIYALPFFGIYKISLVEELEIFSYGILFTIVDPAVINRKLIAMFFGCCFIFDE